MWFKDTGRIVRECSRLTNAELGLLIRLIDFAWQRQGITKNDLRSFAHQMREPYDCVELAWEDFLIFAQERDGKFMLPEQWESIESYNRKRDAAHAGAKARWQKSLTENKGVTDASGMPHGIDVGCHTYATPMPDIDLDKTKTKKKRKSMSGNASALRTSPSWTGQFLDIFREHHDTDKTLPSYSPTEADWGQLKQLKKRAEDGGKLLTPEMWSRAVENYFASNVGVRTIAHLATYANFIAYFKSPLDRYNKPPEEENGKGQQLPTSNVAERIKCESF